MARRRKAGPEIPFGPFTEHDPKTLRTVKADVEPQYTREVIRDAFIEGKDAVAIAMLREMDGRADIKAARKHALEAERISVNVPPNCMGAIPTIVRGFEAVAVARDRLRDIPHEMREPNSILFGKVNKAEKKLLAIRDYAANACAGSIGDRPLTGGPFRKKPRR